MRKRFLVKRAPSDGIQFKDDDKLGIRRSLDDVVTTMSYPRSMHAAHQYPRSCPGLVVAVSLFVKTTKARDQGPCPHRGAVRVIGIAEVAPEPRMAQLPHHNPLPRLGEFYVSLSTAVHPIDDDFLVHQDERATKTLFRVYNFFFYSAPGLPSCHRVMAAPAIEQLSPRQSLITLFFFLNRVNRLWILSHPGEVTFEGHI